MRRRAKVDQNQPMIVRDLRNAGATVQSLSQMGAGVPDLLVGWRGSNFLFEIKDPMRKPSERNLTDDEKAWHFAWRGQVHKIETTADAFRILETAREGAHVHHQ